MVLLSGTYVPTPCVEFLVDQGLQECILRQFKGLQTSLRPGSEESQSGILRMGVLATSMRALSAPLV